MIDWDPEVFIGSITSDGVVPHPDPANCELRVYLVIEISQARFFRDAKYLPSANHDRDFLNTMYRWTATSVYLVAENDDNEIYCVAFGPPYNTPMLFGKLAPDCVIYDCCAKAFGRFVE